MAFWNGLFSKYESLIATLNALEGSENLVTLKLNESRL